LGLGYLGGASVNGCRVFWVSGVNAMEELVWRRERKREERKKGRSR